MSSSRIEQIIDEIEEYIDNCKPQPLSNTKIIVNKEEIEELLVELRMRVPDEIKKYQKIISQQEAIIADAQDKANSMINDAQTQIDSLVSDHEVTQIAYQRASEIVEEAKKQAEGIVNGAVADANSIRTGAMQYTDSLLVNVQNIIAEAAADSRDRYESMLKSMQVVYEECSASRAQLTPMEQPAAEDETASEQ